MTKILALIALAALLCLLLPACATDSGTSASSRPRQSSIPWNRPAGWEGPGVYGSSINQQ